MATRKPHETQDAGAACAIGVFAPKDSSQRSAALCSPYRDSTRARRMPSSSATDVMEPRTGTTARSVTSASSASTSSAISVETTEFGGGVSSPDQPGSRRRSSASVGSRSPGPMSPGRSRSLHGTHSGASRASSPGSSTVSSSVTFLAREARVTVTAQRQPR